MKLLAYLQFHLCFRIEAFFATKSSISISSSSEENLNQLKLDMDDMSTNKGDWSKGLRARKLFEENQDVMIMDSQFDIPENDEIIQLLEGGHIYQVSNRSKMQSPFGNETFVPLSLLKIKIWYDDGFLDHPDIKTTDKAESYIKTTLEHVQHNLCLSTLGTRLQVEVRHFRK